MSAPAHVEEHLFHAWDALVQASRADRAGDDVKRRKNIAYAENREASAKALLHTLSAKDRAAAEIELRHLADEIHYA